ncbi:MAG: hypothetical protein ACXQS9_02210 [Methermicoccaceae archaeon]
MFRLVLSAIIAAILAYYATLLYQRVRTPKDSPKEHISTGGQGGRQVQHSSTHSPKISFRKSIQEMGIPFLSFVADLFPPSEFLILSPSALPSSTTPLPDFLVRCVHSNGLVAMVCRHIHYLPSGTDELEHMVSLAQYARYAANVNVPLYIALGVGGGGFLPSQLYVMSIDEYMDALRTGSLSALSTHTRSCSAPFVLEDGVLR